MDPKLAGILAVVIIVIVGAGAVALKGSHGGNQGTTPTTGSAPVSPSTTGQQSTASHSGIRLEGTWHGVYHGKYGSGEWTWVIVEEGPGRYKGCLKTTGTYAAGWMPISITLSGSKITVGTVGPSAVTFTGTISGDKASGQWQMTGRPEGGDWSGSRTGPATSLPCMTTTTGTPPGTTHTASHSTTTPPYTRTTTQGATQTTTSQGQGGLTCTPAPPPSYQQAYNTLVQATASVVGASNMHCVTAFMVGGYQYAATYHLDNYDASQGGQIAQEIAANLKEAGWNYTRIATASNGTQVQALGVIGGQPFLAYITIQVTSTGTVDLAIQVQPYQG